MRSVWWVETGRFVFAPSLSLPALQPLSSCSPTLPAHSHPPIIIPTTHLVRAGQVQQRELLQRVRAERAADDARRPLHAHDLEAQVAVVDEDRVALLLLYQWW